MNPDDMTEKEREFEYNLLLELRQKQALQSGNVLFSETLMQFENMLKDRSLGSSTRIAILTRCAKAFDRSEQLMREGKDNTMAVLVATKKAEAVYLRSKLERTTYKLHTAAMKGKLDKVEKCIAKYKIAVNARDKFGQTALHYACAAHKEVSMARLLIEDFGADVNAGDLLGITPLHIAASTQRYLVCQYLLSQGASLEEQDKMGSTPLHLAASSGSAKACAVLLAAKADINAVNQRGHTPLHSACRAGRYDVGSLLIDSGADLQAVDENNCIPEDIATGCALELFGHQPRAEEKSWSASITNALRKASVFKGLAANNNNSRNNNNSVPETIPEELTADNPSDRRGGRRGLLDEFEETNNNNNGVIAPNRSPAINQNRTPRIERRIAAHPTAAPYEQQQEDAAGVGVMRAIA